MADPITTILLTKAERDGIWALAQDLGAAIDPILERVDPPRWVERLNDALRDACQAITDQEDRDAHT